MATPRHQEVALHRLHSHEAKPEEALLRRTSDERSRVLVRSQDGESKAAIEL